MKPLILKNLISIISKISYGELMENLKQELTNLIEETMIPEYESFLEELHESVANKTVTSDDMDAIRDIESFLVELQNILSAMEANKISDEEIKEIHKKITTMLNEHEEHD